jgi:hypothetical protein
MRLARGLMGVVLAAAIGFGAAGCDTLDSFDMDFLNTKKKLPGQRKPVFPEGVPGVVQGVPPEFTKGYDEKAAQAAPDPAAAAAQQVATEKPKPAAKPKPESKPKPKPVARQAPPAQPAQAQPATQSAPWPQQQQQQQQQSQPQGTWPQSQPQAAWPTAPNPNQFSR